MKIILPLIDACSDDKRITDSVMSDLKKETDIYIFKSVEDWLLDDEENIYSIWIQYAENKNLTLMFKTNLDDLEMFASSLTKSIEMVRRDYADSIKFKKENDLPL